MCIRSACDPQWINPMDDRSTKEIEKEKEKEIQHLKTISDVRICMVDYFTLNHLVERKKNKLLGNEKTNFWRLFDESKNSQNFNF